MRTALGFTHRKKYGTGRKKFSGAPQSAAGISNYGCWVLQPQPQLWQELELLPLSGQPMHFLPFFRSADKYIALPTMAMMTNTMM
jgi:hypothetical protein